MRKKFFTILMTVLALSLTAYTQTTTPALKHFAAKGLSFDYPASIELEDQSTDSGQHLVIQTKGQAQIMVVSRYAEINSAEQLAASRHEVVESFIDTMWQKLHELDPNATRTSAEIEVAGAPAPGVRLRAIIDNEPGNAEIYSLQLGQRLVLISLIGSDKEIAAAAPAWLAVRRSLKM